MKPSCIIKYSCNDKKNLYKNEMVFFFAPLEQTICQQKLIVFIF